MIPSLLPSSNNFQNPLNDHPTVSVLDRVKRFIQSDQFRSIADCYPLIQELVALVRSDYVSAREGFCHLLKLNFEEIQQEVIRHLTALVDLSTLIFDVENQEPMNFLVLEKNVREVIDYSLRSSSTELLCSLLFLYKKILERLWLLSYLIEDRSSYVKFIEENLPLIKASAENWLKLLESIENDEITFLIKSIRIGMQKIISSPPSIIEKIVRIKPHLKSGVNLIFVGNICLEMGDLLSAIFHFTCHLNIIRQCQKNETILSDLHKKECEILIVLGNAYFLIEENEIAIKYYDESLFIARNHNLPRMQGLALRELGKTYFLTDPMLGEVCYNESLDIFKALEDSSESSYTHASLGSSYLHKGEIPKAIQNLETSSLLAEQSKKPEKQIEPLRILGNAYFSLGKSSHAIEWYLKALGIAEATSNSRAKGRIYGDLGNAYLSLNDPSNAIKYHQLGLEIANALGDLDGQATLCGSIGADALAVGAFDQAISCYRECITIGEKIGASHHIGKALGGIGNAYSTLGKCKEAIPYYQGCLKILEKRGAHRDQAATLAHLGICFAELSDFREAEIHFKQSISIFSDLQIKLGDHFEWKITIFEDQVKAFVELEKVLIKQNKKLEALQITDARRSRALVSKLINNINLREIQKINHETYMPIAEMQSLAKKLNTTFIIYSLTPIENNEKSIYVWIISSDGKIELQTLPYDDLEEIKDPNKLFQTYPYEMPSQIPALVNEKKYFQAQLKKWYNILIAPIEKFLPSPSQTLTIIPDKFLSQIPFACFQDEEGKYLIEKHPISFAPSLKVVQLLDQFPPIFPETFFLAYNPTTPFQQENKLIQTKLEAEAIGELLDKSIKREIITQKTPTVNFILEKMAYARWIHLSCHGMIGNKLDEKLDPYSVFEGFFKLVADEKHPKGHLHAQEIASHPLNAELAFLSACHSGRGKLQQEGTIGPNWAFLAAGVQSTIASYWPVPDTTITVKIVKTFYEQWLGGKINKSQALQKAILSGMEDLREGNNLHKYREWGGFFLSGLI